MSAVAADVTKKDDDDEVQDDVAQVDMPDNPVEETDDGGAIVTLQESKAEEEKVYKFYDNIAEVMPLADREALSVRLLDDIKRDKESRKKREDQYAESIRRTGLGNEAPGGAQFEGASRVVHPLLTRACVDFEARAIKELLPPNGPVRTFIPMLPGGEVPPERQQKADRKKAYMNWQFLTQMPEFRSELEQLLTQLPLGGSQYLRLTPDQSKRRKRPIPEFVPVDKVYLPYAASNFYTAERVTFVDQMTEFEFQQRVKLGMYMDIGPSTKSSQTPEQTKPQQASEKVEGKDNNSGNNEDGLKNVFEVSCWISFPEDEEAQKGKDPEAKEVAPYLISIDEPSHKIVSIVRNWEEEDQFQDRMFWMVEFPFVPWRGAYSVGLGQMIGSLAGGATGALRALLDSAHINNMPTAVRLKGANFSGQSTQLNPTEIAEIHGGVEADDIRKLIMPLPYNPPSETLVALLGLMVDAGEGVVRTTFEDLAEQKTEMPVGTTLALIEEGQKVLSAIHLRLYHAMDYVIRLLHRIDKMYLDEEDVKNDIGEVLAKRSDFELPLDVVPVADPEIFSDVQRMAQLQIVGDRAALHPDIYNLRKVEERILERTKIPNYKELLNPEPKPVEMNQVNENAAMVFGRPVSAFPQQDHLGHIQVLLNFVESPLFGRNPLIAPKFLQPAMNHLVEHMTFWYVNEFYELMKRTLGYDEDGMTLVMKQRDAQTKIELDKTLAAASPRVMRMAMGTFGAIPQIIQQAQQLIQQIMPPMAVPTDPNKMADIQSKKETAIMTNQTKERMQTEALQAKANEATLKGQLQRQSDLEKLSAEERRSALESAREDQRQAQEVVARLEELDRKEQAEHERTAATLASEERRNTQDNLTATTIAGAEIESSEKVKLSTGTGINPSGSQK